jgi:putative ABC transport system permease protein
MAYAPERSAARLVQVVGVEGGFPFYGAVRTEPPGLWERLGSGGGALVDPVVLPSLDTRVGDVLAIGEARVPIRGVVLDFPGDVAVRAAFGPRVFIAGRDVASTRLLSFGSRSRHEVFLRLSERADADRLARRHRPALAAERVGLRTASEGQELAGDALGRLGRYLGLVALVALLLGGLGVASAIHVFVKRRLETIAVLRCLGATGRQVLAVYVTQALAMALLGSLAGAALGTLLQLLLPRVVGDLLPVDVPVAASWPAAAGGVGLGVWSAALFALIPILPVRRVSPLAALRRPYEEDGRAGRRDPARLAAAAALGASVVAIAALESRSFGRGVAFAAAIGAAVAALAAAAVALTRATRWAVSPSWPYVWRQGIANLFRPANQTLTVVLAIGFGAFLLDTLLFVQHNLLADLRPLAAGERPNLALWDIQPDQRDGVAEELWRAGADPRPPVPIVPMRIASVKGVEARSVLAAAGTAQRSGSPNPWTLRREYRSTYRDELAPSERIVTGERWAKGAWRARGREGPIPVSLEADVAHELGVTVGDEIVWDVQGLRVPSRVASLREVQWARFEPNFFAVFPEGPLDAAPQTFVSLARVEGDEVRARLERRVVERFPNVTALDLSQVQQAIEGLIARAALAIRFMALFSLAAGVVVLAGAVATSRFQRLREAVLLRTLGATRGQILGILLAEYLALGALAAASALLLAALAGWSLARFVFETGFALPAAPLAALVTGLVALTVGVGLAGSLEALRRPPLEVLRTE